ncbi:MAG: RodZ domain-containing protein [Alphaproteobacteria bacterium]
MASQGPSDATGGGVGALLAEERKRQGLTLDQVSAMLRIRQPYLEAIELGRIEELPGHAYALGFVRAYADYLRLDGGEIIRRFKEGAAGLNRRTELLFPSPVSEGRFPGRIAIAASAAAAVIVYGIWHNMASRDRSVTESVPSVPVGFAGQDAEKPSEDKAEEEAKPADGTSPEGASAGNATSTSPSTPAGASAPPLSSTSPPTTSSASAPAAVSMPPPSMPASATPAVTQSPPAMATAPIAPASTGQNPASVPTSPAASRSASVTPPSPPAMATPAPKAPTPDGPVYGAEGNVRVVLRARAESWVQVQDAKGNVVGMRLLKPGESFRVPNLSGLTLSTGNAGGIEATVDGKAVPALGAPGTVRKNIPLDPEKLLAGG